MRFRESNYIFRPMCRNDKRYISWVNANYFTEFLFSQIFFRQVGKNARGAYKKDMVDTRRQRYKTDKQGGARYKTHKQGHERYKTDKQGHERYEPLKQECGRILVASKGAATIFEVCHKCIWFVKLEIIALHFQYMVWDTLACHSKPSTLLFVRFIAFMALFVRFIAFATLFVRFIALAPSVNHIPFTCPTGILTYCFNSVFGSF